MRNLFLLMYEIQRLMKSKKCNMKEMNNNGMGVSE